MGNKGMHIIWIRWAICLAMVCLCVLGSFPTLLSSFAEEEIVDLRIKKQSTENRLKKIRQLKHQIAVQERYVTTNIIHNQQRLEKTKSSLVQQSKMLDTAKVDLVHLESDLGVVLTEQQQLSQLVGKRLRYFYMGEHLTWLHMLLDAHNVSSFMDRLYFQKRIYDQDRQLIAQYQKKTKVLEQKKSALAWHKVKLANTIRSIQGYQNQLQESVQLDQVLVTKLKNSRHAYEMAEDQLEKESNDIAAQIQRLAGGNKVVAGSTGRFSLPVIAPIRSGFGYRVHPVYRSRRFHSGLDFGARYGTPVKAADGGQVIYAGWRGGYGKVVIINHGRNLTTLYGHLSGVACSANQSVGKGQVVGYVGSTGLSTGPHLHFEVRVNGHPVNPLGYLR